MTGSRAFIMGVERYNSSNYEAARELLQEHVRKAGYDARPMAYLILGEIERALDNHCGSIELYQVAFESGAKYQLHHAGVNLAYAALRCGKVDRAQKTIEAAAKDQRVMADTNARRDVKCCMAIVYRRRGHDAFNDMDWLGAEKWYTKALEQRPDFVDVACDLAVARLRLSQALFRTATTYTRDRALEEILAAREVLEDARYNRHYTADKRARIDEVKEWVHKEWRVQKTQGGEQ